MSKSLTTKQEIKNISATYNIPVVGAEKHRIDPMLFLSPIITEVTADIAPSSAVGATEIFINPDTANSFNLTGTWWDGDTVKAIAPGRAVGITRTSNNKLFILFVYNNLPMTPFSSGFSSGF